MTYNDLQSLTMREHAGATYWLAVKQFPYINLFSSSILFFFFAENVFDNVINGPLFLDTKHIGCRKYCKTLALEKGSSRVPS